MPHDIDLIAPVSRVAPLERFLATSSAWLMSRAAQHAAMAGGQTRPPWGDGARLPGAQWSGPIASSHGPTTPISTAK
jgi:hypothetical protein